MHRTTLLSVIFTVAVLVVAAVTIMLLYHTALSQEAARLEEVARSEARTIEAVARHEAKYSHLMLAESGHGDARDATLAQLRDANERFGGFGRTGEFTLARRQGDSIVYLLSQRNQATEAAKTLPFNGSRGEPMRRALSGLAGTVIGPDYRGVTVLAAYEPVGAFGMGVVAKIDLVEVQAPFVRAGLVSLVVTLLVVVLGVLLFNRITNPVINALRESEERFRAVASNTPDHVLVQDRELRYELVVNPQLGLTEQDMLGKTDYDFLSESDADRLAAMKRQVMQTGRPLHVEAPLTSAKGELEFFDGTYVPRFDPQGRSNGVIGYVRNVTDDKRAEERLRATMDELERSNADLEQFAYVASHDLQEPLRMIASYVGLLSERYRGKLDERADRYIDYAVNGARRMQLLIDGLLHYARAGTKGGAAVAVDMAAAAAEAQANLSQEITDANAVVEVGPLPEVLADRGQMVQVLQNLLSNAVKFRGDRPPKVSVSGRDAGKEWEFAVQDNGIGIDPKHAERVFGVFKRLHTAQEYPGTGIGLALCRKIVERHGGRIWMEPADGGGSVFRFTLPKQPPTRIELPARTEDKEA